MRSANHIALMKLRLEGYEVVHRKKFKNNDARWLVLVPGKHTYAYRSPAQAWMCLEYAKAHKDSIAAYFNMYGPL